MRDDEFIPMSFIGGVGTQAPQSAQEALKKDKAIVYDSDLMYDWLKRTVRYGYERDFLPGITNRYVKAVALMATYFEEISKAAYSLCSQHPELLKTIPVKNSVLISAIPGKTKALLWNEHWSDNGKWVSTLPPQWNCYWVRAPQLMYLVTLDLIGRGKTQNKPIGTFLERNVVYGGRNKNMYDKLRLCLTVEFEDQKNSLGVLQPAPLTCLEGAYIYLGQVTLLEIMLYGLSKDTVISDAIKLGVKDAETSTQFVATKCKEKFLYGLFILDVLGAKFWNNGTTKALTHTDRDFSWLDDTRSYVAGFYDSFLKCMTRVCGTDFTQRVQNFRDMELFYMLANAHKNYLAPVKQLGDLGRYASYIGIPYSNDLEVLANHVYNKIALILETTGIDIGMLRKTEEVPDEIAEQIPSGQLSGPDTSTIDEIAPRVQAPTAPPMNTPPVVIHAPIGSDERVGSDLRQSLLSVQPPLKKQKIDLEAKLQSVQKKIRDLDEIVKEYETKKPSTV